MSRKESFQALGDQVGRAQTKRNSRLNITCGSTEAAATAASLTGRSAWRRAITARAQEDLLWRERRQRPAVFNGQPGTLISPEPSNLLREFRSIIGRIQLLHTSSIPQASQPSPSLIATHKANVA